MTAFARFTPEEDEYLRFLINVKQFIYPDVGLIMGRTDNSIANRVHRLRQQGQVIHPAFKIRYTQEDVTEEMDYYRSYVMTKYAPQPTITLPEDTATESVSDEPVTAELPVYVKPSSRPYGWYAAAGFLLTVILTTAFPELV